MAVWACAMEQMLPERTVRRATDARRHISDLPSPAGEDERTRVVMSELLCAGVRTFQFEENSVEFGRESTPSSIVVVKKSRSGTPAPLNWIDLSLRTCRGRQQQQYREKKRQSTV